MRFVRPLLLLLPGLLAGCAEAPFIDMGTASTTVVSIDKPTDTLLETGSFRICHASETPMSEVAALAEERCGEYGLKTAQGITQRWQCRISAPHRTTFSCFDPGMTDETGAYVNPFDKRAVAAWEKRTGKTFKLKNPRLIGLPVQIQPTPGTAAESAVETVPAPMENAAPAEEEPAIVPLPAPPPPAPPVDSGFTLPQGSWGDAFKQ